MKQIEHSPVQAQHTLHQDAPSLLAVLLVGAEQEVQRLQEAGATAKGR